MTGDVERLHIFDFPVVPLASIASPDTVDAIGDGLVLGGMPVVEVALRGAHGLTSLRRLGERGDV